LTIADAHGAAIIVLDYMFESLRAGVSGVHYSNIGWGAWAKPFVQGVSRATDTVTGERLFIQIQMVYHVKECKNH
jgi:hypothetical protein